MLPGLSSMISCAACGWPCAEKSETRGATASGPARPAAQASMSFSLKAISMAASQGKEERAGGEAAPRRDGFAIVPWLFLEHDLLRKTGSHFSGSCALSVGHGRDVRGRFHLGHQIVVPLAFNLEVRGGAELGRLDQIVRDIGVDAGLQELVHRSPCRAASDEPGLEPGLGNVAELAGLPDI